MLVHKGSTAFPNLGMVEELAFEYIFLKNDILSAVYRYKIGSVNDPYKIGSVNDP